MFIFIILLCLPGALWAQDGIEAYNRGSLSQAWNRLQEDSCNPDEADFLRAAMTTNADSAVEIYRQIVLRNPESTIAKQALDRIRQYYYAQGLYMRAEEIGKSLGDWKPPQHRLRMPESTPPPPFTMSSNTSPAVQKSKPEETAPQITEAKTYDLQVGAFTGLTNAKNLQAMLEKAGYKTVILSPPEQSTIFHVLRVVGFKTEEEALSAAKNLQRKFKLKPILVGGEGGQ